MKIIIHNKKDLLAMRKAGLLAARVLDHITPYVKSGISTAQIDDICADFIKENGATSACLGYNGYPKNICTSINHVICHGIPTATRILKKGDIINIDVTVILDGYFGDTSRMYAIGNISVKAKKLIKVTHEALLLAIKTVKPGNYIGDIGYTIQTYVEKQNFSVVRDYIGHGIGKNFHQDPPIFHFASKDRGIKLREGMFFTIEPMINAGKKETRLLKDSWTVVTADKSLSAQFEHTIAVTAKGYEILTLSPKHLFFPTVIDN